MEIQVAQPLVTKPIPSEVEIDIAKLKRYKLPGIDQLLPELIEAVGGVHYCTNLQEA
jgi:hypothetical protein